MLLARQQRADRICTPGAGSRGVFEGGVYKGSEAPSRFGTVRRTGLRYDLCRNSIRLGSLMY